MAKAGVFTAGAAGIGGLFLTLKAGTSEFSQAARETAKVQAIIKATGGVANVSSKHVDTLATSIMKYSGIDDEAVKSGAALLLTFKNVRNEVGAGNDMFDRATKAAVDLSVAGFGSIESASKMLGKALQDPEKGITALSRAGVTFTQQQKDLIKHLVATGDAAGAQKLIMKEVESQVKGTAKAVGDTLPGMLNKARERFNNFAGDLVGKVTPALGDFVGKISHADGFQAKIGVVFSGIGDAMKTLKEKLFGGTASPIASLPEVKIPFDGIIQKGIKSVNWAAVGRSIVDGLVQGLSAAAEIAGKLAAIISQTMDRINWEAVGSKVGPALAAALVSALATLVDPGFWARHWEEMLAIALAVIPLGKLVEIGGRIVSTLVSPIVDRLAPELGAAMGRGADLLLEIAGALPGKLGTIFISVVTRVGTEFGRIPGVLGDIAGRAVAFVGEKLGFFYSTVTKALAFDAIIQFVSQKVSDIVGFFERLPGRIGSAIAGAAGELKSAVTGLFGKVIDWVKGVFGINSPSTVFAEIGRNMIRGFIHGVGGMAGTLKDYVVDLAKSLIPKFEAPVGSGLVSGSGGLVGRVLNALNYARQMGWHGSVISGFRSYAEQAALYERYRRSGFDPRYIAAKPGSSSHERGEAVDVSDASRFDSIMAGAPPGAQLFNNVPGDFNHFSVSGHAAGGIINKPLHMFGEAGPEAVIPLAKWMDGWQQVKHATDTGWKQVTDGRR
jgi:hypothetical protein